MSGNLCHRSCSESEIKEKTFILYSDKFSWFNLYGSFLKLVCELYNIGWHWGLYENILHASWWYSPSQYGEVNIIMTSAIYSHTTQNKAIQYYYYYIIWSWLYSEIPMYTVYVRLQVQALQLSSTLLTEVVRIRQACVGLPTPFSQIIVALTLLPLPGCLYIWWFLWILLGKS